MDKLFISAAMGLLVTVSPMGAAEKPQVLLWQDKAPHAVGEADTDRPRITVWLPDKPAATGASVVICPGGGYRHLAMDHEGVQIAQWLNDRGLAAFILQYRLGPTYKHPVMMLDVQRAVRLVRANAAEYKIAPDKIGIWGFSAGGHLASTAGTHFDDGDPKASDPIDRVSSRPDFMILCYPVITMSDPYTHRGSRTNLLGENPDPELVKLMSNELQVTEKTPPTFLFHTTEDKAVPPENSILFYQALRRAGIDGELHIYQNGRHGVGLAPNDPVLSSWPKRLDDWLTVRGLK